MSKKLRQREKFKRKPKDNKSTQSLIPQCMYDEVKKSCIQFYEKTFYKRIKE